MIYSFQAVATVNEAIHKHNFQKAVTETEHQWQKHTKNTKMSPENIEWVFCLTLIVFIDIDLTMALNRVTEFNISVVTCTPLSNRSNHKMILRFNTHWPSFVFFCGTHAFECVGVFAVIAVRYHFFLCFMCRSILCQFYHHRHFHSKNHTGFRCGWRENSNVQSNATKK